MSIAWCKRGKRRRDAVAVRDRFERGGLTECTYVVDVSLALFPMACLCLCVTGPLLGLIASKGVFSRASGGSSGRHGGLVEEESVGSLMCVRGVRGEN
jgi:hypothetical protein